MAIVTLGIVLVAINAVAASNSVELFIVDDLITEFSVGWLWITFLLVLTPLLVVSGRLGDMWGRSTLFRYGFLIIAIASPLFGLAPNFSWLLVFRATQAVGASMLLSLGFGLLVEAFPTSERGRAFGIVVSAGSIATIIGALFVFAIGWQWVSVLGLPIALAGAIFSRRSISPSPSSGGETFDVAGAILFTGSTVCLILGLVFGSENGFTDGWVLLLMAMSAGLMVNFVWIESRVDSPLVDIDMFKTRGFGVAVLNGFLIAVALAALQQSYLTGWTFGVFLLTLTAGWLVSAPIAGLAIDRSGPRSVALKGLALMALGFLATQNLTTDTGLWLVALVGAVIGVGAGTFLAANYTTIMTPVQTPKLGVAGGLLGFGLALAPLVAAAFLGPFFIQRLLERPDFESMVEVLLGTFRVSMMVALASTLVAMLLAWRFYEDKAATEQRLPSLSPDGDSVSRRH